MLREEHRFRLFENRMLRRIVGHKRKEVAEAGEDCIMKRFVSCTFRKVLLG
jgi:hypothetical protein